jgi:hypothetical protein
MLLAVSFACRPDSIAHYALFALCPGPTTFLGPTKKSKGEQIKIQALKIGKIIRNTKFNFFFKNQNSTISLRVKWEVCEKSTFLSLCLANGVVGVIVIIIVIIIIM